MASNSTISITFKLNGDSKTLKDLIKDSEGLKNALQSATVEADKLPKAFGKMQFSGLGKQIAGLATGFLSLKAAFGVVKDGISTIAGFERANSELASVLGKSVSDIQELTRAAQDLGRTTEFTASEVTSLQTALARLGFDQGQILDMQEPVLKFAAAVGTDLSSAADFAGSALRAFGLKSSETKPLLDMMAASTSKSALSFSKLYESMSTVGPVAHAFNLSAADTVSLLGVLSNNGFDASSAATALRNILLNLSDSNGKLVSGLGHTAKTMPEIIEAFKELRDRGVDLNEALAMTDKRSVAAFEALVAGADDVAELNAELHECDGALDQMYSTMTDNLEGAVKSLKSAWEGLVLTIRNSTGPVTDFLNRFTRGVRAVTDLIGGKSMQDIRTQRDADALRASGKYQTLEDYDEAIGVALQKGFDQKGGKYKRTYEALLKARFDTWHEAELAAISALADAPEPVTPTGGTGGSGKTGKTKASGLPADLKEDLAILRALREEEEMWADQNDKAFDSFVDGVKKMSDKTGIDELSSMLDSLNPKLAELAKPINGSTEAISALSMAFSGLEGIVSETAGSWMSWISNLLRAVAQAIPAISAVIVAHKTAAKAAAEQGIMESMAFSALGGPALAIAAGATVAASLAAMISSIPKFAAGGIAYGPTLGLFGEYAGAVNNPEVVAPLNTLRTLLLDDTSSSPKKIEFHIKGRDFVALYETERSIRKRG